MNHPRLPHQCLNCRRSCDADKIYCLPCWRRLPQLHRTAIYKTYDSGKGAQSPAYRRAVLASLRQLRGEEGTANG